MWCIIVWEDVWEGTLEKIIGPFVSEEKVEDFLHHKYEERIRPLIEVLCHGGCTIMNMEAP